MSSPVQCASDFKCRDISDKQSVEFHRPEQEPESSEVANIQEEFEKSFKPGLNCVSS